MVPITLFGGWRVNHIVIAKRCGLSLPPGCNDLAVVLQWPKRRGFHPVRSFIILVLVEAHQATELVIGSAPESGDTLIRYKTGDTWRESAFPSDKRLSVIAELRRMARLPPAQFPSEGAFSVRLESTRLRWRVRMTSPDAECVLTPCS